MPVRKLGGVRPPVGDSVLCLVSGLNPELGFDHDSPLERGQQREARPCAELCIAAMLSVRGAAENGHTAPRFGPMCALCIVGAEARLTRRQAAARRRLARAIPDHAVPLCGAATCSAARTTCASGASTAVGPPGMGTNQTCIMAGVTRFREPAGQAGCPAPVTPTTPRPARRHRFVCTCH